MYHRYMPTENGQYRRQAVQESPVRTQQPQKQEPPQRQSPSRQERQAHAAVPPQSTQPEAPSANQAQCRPTQPRPAQPSCPAELPCKPERCDGRPRLPFLERLFPNIDSGDLLLILVLLFLMAEGNEDSEQIVLTLLICLLL